MNEAPVLYVSAISGFEVAIKAARGKLALPLSPAEWLEKIADHHGLSILPLDLEVCIRAEELPPIHNDPCDRFIIATALLNNLPIVTAEERFEAYGVTIVN